MAFGNRILYFITFTCLLHSTKPSNFNGDTLFQGHDQLTTTNSLICSSGLFTLSFFQLDESEYFYLGIRLSVVNSSYNWVANRDEPIRDPSVALTIDQYGNLKIISNGGNSTIMLYSSSKPESNSNSTIITSAILQDNGNFVLQEINQDGSVKNILWQSFDYPTNMLLPGMKLGFDRKTGQNWSITSWRSGKSPLSGSFSLGLDHKTKEMVMWWREKIVWSSGQWSNGNFANLKSSLYEKDFVFEYYSDEDETYVKYVPVYGYIIMGSLGIIYGSSGASYSCSDNKYFLSGCSMPSAHKCTDVDSLYLGSSESRYGVMAGKGFIFDAKEKLSHFDCWMKCLNNCSCEAYSYVNADATGCEIWSKGTANFSDTNNLITGSRQIYFIRSGKGKLSPC
ncbi:G-type lectin S-receptor-like serine/threonine-protein kinase CES101 [Glycine max]|uniref:G-type lectin S-receptor-like serine/threonine-protein kinase CES101 n=1 Tax=Glycine max TaxID=3847 RepID=UPI00023D9CF4|nr:G-type lectin S-receptor-like serine/threonine-protein kinase CES101 [Glycine max]|eukprot:XP_014625929.1 G-type lectin S-receptor-like serine/threonine-protein kinase CES101 [Glycine max]